MHVEGKVTIVGPIQSGTSQKTGNAWQKQQFVLEYLPGQYPKSIPFDTLDANVVGKLKVGMRLAIDYDVEARPYTAKDGSTRYMTNITIWRNGIHSIGAQGSSPQQQPLATQQQPQQTIQPAQQQNEQLPF